MSVERWKDRGEREREERSLAFTRDFLLEEYLFNFPAVKPGAGAGERAGTCWGERQFPVRVRPPPPFKGAEETEEEGKEGVLVARSTVEVERETRDKN